MKIQHLGVVAENVDELLGALGLDRSAITETVHDPAQKNNLHFIRLKENDMWLEIVEPTAPDSSTRNFAKKNGLGLHHLGFESGSLDKEQAKHANRPGAFTLGRYQIEVKSFGGRIRTLFVAVKGLILEYVQRDG